MAPSAVRRWGIAVILSLGASYFYVHRLIGGLQPRWAAVAAVGACAGCALAAYGVLFRAGDIDRRSRLHPPGEVLIGAGLAVALASGLWWA